MGDASKKCKYRQEAQHEPEIFKCSPDKEIGFWFKYLPGMCS
jgi:hypothetical protein